jgi:hypothetical protein
MDASFGLSLRPGTISALDAVAAQAVVTPVADACAYV